MRSAPVDEQEAMRAATRLLDLDPTGAHLFSSSSRLTWYLPAPRLALTISRPDTKTQQDVIAETAAIRAATAAGVQTPGLRAGPVALTGDRWAFATDWITGRRPEPADWPAIAAAAAKLADAPTAGLRPFAWPDGLDDPRIGEILGDELHSDLLARSAAAAETFAELVAAEPPVLAHMDLQPANVLCNNTGAWLLDLEYAALAPREWDPAKLVILARRFGDPPDIIGLLGSWVEPDSNQLRDCVAIQESLLVIWLARMAVRATSGAADETRHRLASIDTTSTHWHHLR